MIHDILNQPDLREVALRRLSEVNQDVNTEDDLFRLKSLLQELQEESTYLEIERLGKDFIKTPFLYTESTDDYV